MKIGDLVKCRDDLDENWSGPFILLGYDTDVETEYRFKTEYEWFKYCEPYDLEFKPGDLVMVRDFDSEEWQGPLFFGYYNGNSAYPFRTVDDMCFKQCRRATKDDTKNFGEPIREPQPGDIVMCRRSTSAPWRGPFVLVEPRYADDMFAVGGGETFAECRLAEESELP